MQREIKFRAWDKATNRMLETGFHVIGEVTCFDIIAQKLMQEPLGRTTLDRMGDIVLMQYSGHKINNVDLYEYDILRNEKFTDDLDDVEYLICVFISEWAIFGLLTIEEYHNYLNEGANSLDEFLFWTFPIDDKENEQRRICGDIYSTPELIKSL